MKNTITPLYPKSAALVQNWDKLFDFFDSHNIFVLPDRDGVAPPDGQPSNAMGELWMVQVMSFESNDTDFAKDRKDAERKGFTEAFRILEARL